jgi:hypothetical protein
MAEIRLRGSKALVQWDKEIGIDSSSEATFDPLNRVRVFYYCILYVLNY